MTKKRFFKRLATALLMPGGFILTFVVAVLLAVLLTAAIYIAAFCAVACWIVSCVRAFVMSFRKAARIEAAPRADRVGPAALAAPSTTGGLPEDSISSHEAKVWTQREAA